MSYFDGKIPEACRACFHFVDGKWKQIDPGCCDNCDFMLDMFPLITSDGILDREKCLLLEIMEPPEWEQREPSTETKQ